jgi:hypothetical protein
LGTGPPFGLELMLANLLPSRGFLGRLPEVPKAPRRCPKGLQMAEICFQRAPGQDLAQNGRFPRIPEGDFNSQPRGRQRPELCFQKAPGKDLAQKGRFRRVPEGNFTCRPRGRQMPRNLLPKGSRPGFGPKRAVSQWSQKGILIAGPKAFKRQKFASKRLHASPSQELSFLGTSRYVSAAFQKPKIPRTQNGGDFNTKKCWFDGGRCQIPTLGL